jgi:hypothetical protein
MGDCKIIIGMRNSQEGSLDSFKNKATSLQGWAEGAAY